MVLWLVYAELFIIDAICIYCTVVHGLTLMFFLVVVAATVSGTGRPTRRRLRRRGRVRRRATTTTPDAGQVDDARVGTAD